MIRDIVKDESFLSIKSADATEADRQVAQDLLDTLAHHSDECVGLAANMIGVSKRVIVFDNGGTPQVMFNPVIVSAAAPYSTQEGCLSLEGAHEAKRFRRIRVKYLDQDFVEHTRQYRDWTAQIIQHEIDHCNGVLV